jgi:hypothetical protein
MKQLKIIGLALVAVAALTALVGATGAQAAGGPASLCKESTSAACPAAKQYPSGTVLAGETKSGTATWSNVTEGAKLATNLGNVICDSSVTGHTTEATNATSGLAGVITALTFTNCTLAGNTCTVSTVHLPYHSEILTEGVTGKGTLVATSGGTGNPGATVVCGELINCTYTIASAKLPVTGGAPMVANAKAENIALGKEGGKCTETAKWTATYLLTSPNEEVFVGM